MKTVNANPTQRAAIHAIVVGQMASVLIANRCDLVSKASCRAALFTAGFGEASIDKLLARATTTAALPPINPET